MYGPQTEAAIRHFQEGSSGLEVDGIVGPKTWAALFDGGHATESRPVTDPVAQFIDAVSKPLPPGIAAPHEERPRPTRARCWSTATPARRCAPCRSSSMLNSVAMT